jgi:glycerol-3-phosphate O-acyltransferase / dihydroxyacetone phosphate acyltransferase
MANPLLLVLYYILKAIVVVTLRIFYPRAAVINRHLLRQPGPVIIIFNHPNTLLDALLAAVAIKGQTFFLANYSLFKNPVAAWLLNRLYCIPIQRHQDTDGKPLQNENSFARADAHLAAGGRLLIAPEGASLPGRRIRPFKTGAARIALSAESKANFELGLRFLPIGLTYERPHRFGGSVVVHVGEPVAVRPFVAIHAADPMQAVRELTAALEKDIKQLVVHTEDEAEDKLLHQVEILLQNENPQPLRESYLRARQVSDAFRQGQHAQPQKWERFSRDVRAYFGRLSALGLQDRDIVARSFSDLWLLIPALWLALPVFAFGWAANALPFHLPGLISDRLNVVPEYKATWKYVAGLAFFSLWYVFLFQILRTQLPAATCWAVVAAVPVAGWAAWKYFKGALYTWQRFRAWRRFRRHPELKQEWRELRGAILNQMPVGH